MGLVGVVFIVKYSKTAVDSHDDLAIPDHSSTKQLTILLIVQNSCYFKHYVIASNTTTLLLQQAIDLAKQHHELAEKLQKVQQQQRRKSRKSSSSSSKQHKKKRSSQESHRTPLQLLPSSSNNMSSGRRSNRAASSSSSPQDQEENSGTSKSNQLKSVTKAQLLNHNEDLIAQLNEAKAEKAKLLQLTAGISGSKGKNTAAVSVKNLPSNLKAAMQKTIKFDLWPHYKFIGSALEEAFAKFVLRGTNLKYKKAEKQAWVARYGGAACSLHNAHRS